MNTGEVKYSGDEQAFKKITEAAKQLETKTADEVRYNGRPIPLKSDRLKQVFKRVDTAQIEIKTESDTQEKIKLMLRAGNVMEDATQTIQKEKREEALKVGEASG